MKIITKNQFDKIQNAYKGTFSDYQGTHPEWKGRRTAFLPGEGTTLFIEGVHFLVEGDYSHLPELRPDNARLLNCYRFGNSYTQVIAICAADQEVPVAVTTTGEVRLPGYGAGRRAA